MPALLSINGLRVVKYPNDHRPRHVHVIGAKGEATFVMGRPGTAPKLRDTYGFTAEQIDTIAEALAEQLGRVHIA
jgi:hypothetical protein